MRRLLLSLIVSLTGLSALSAQSETVLEAENAIISNCKVITEKQYSNGKAVELTEGNAKITFTFNAQVAGKYLVYVCYDALYGAKVINVTVNGNTSTLQTLSNVIKKEESGSYIMKQGENTIEITPNWTYFRIDYISIVIDSNTTTFDINERNVDAQATVAAVKMYSFLYENFGKKTISGMMTGDMSGAGSNVTLHADVQAFYNVSGKYPALIGFDFMNATGSYASTSYYKQYTASTMALAKDTYSRGGLPAFSWHWRDPSHTVDDFYSEKCNVRISDAMNSDGSWNTSSSLYKYFIRDIDAVADLLLEMQEEGMACIFRPLHEASGAWFWWGNDGAENCAKLYRLIYDEMVNVKGVHNVIWVWNPCRTNDSDWNPGEEYYDIISIDIYNNSYDYSSNYTAFDKLKSLSDSKKIIALAENGPIPDIDNEFNDYAVWSWWMPWYQTWNGNFLDKTSTDEWKKCMNDSRVISLEDLSSGWNNYSSVIQHDTTKSSSEVIYNIQGYSPKFTSKFGLYIRNGKKYIVK